RPRPAAAPAGPRRPRRRGSPQAPRGDRLHVLLLEGPHRREQDAQPYVNEVDVRDRQRDIAREHHALVEHAVDQFQERHLVLQRWGAHGTPSSAGTKLYGGQGPVSSSSTPLSRYSAASSPTSCSKRARAATR